MASQPEGNTPLTTVESQLERHQHYLRIAQLATELLAQKEHTALVARHTKLLETARVPCSIEADVASKLDCSNFDLHDRFRLGDRLLSGLGRYIEKVQASPEVTIMAAVFDANKSVLTKDGKKLQVTVGDGTTMPFTTQDDEVACKQSLLALAIGLESLLSVPERSLQDHADTVIHRIGMTN